MIIEQEIRQEKFGNVYEKAMINIMFTSSWIHNLNSARLKIHGITPEQYNVLRILRGSYPNPIMLAEITGRMIDKSSNATRLVEKLRQKEFLKRETCENNRRQVDILITEKGLTILKTIDKETEDWLKNLENISPKEAEQLNNLLDRLRG